MKPVLLFAKFFSHQSPRTNLRIFLIACWSLMMVSLPIVRWTLGESALHVGIIVVVLVQSGVVLLFLLQDWGWVRTLTITISILLLAWFAEWIGTNTGVIFGEYHYTKILQPQVFGVPILIPLAWMMMLPPSWAIAAAIMGSPQSFKDFRARLLFCGLSMLAFTAWDFFLDPQMVSWNFWTWDQPGGYFGIPWHNYIGWLFVSGVISALFGQVKLPVKALFVVYTLTWILQSIGQAFFWGLPGPALVGFISMGLMVALAWRRISLKK